MSRTRTISAGQLSLFCAAETPDAFKKAVQVVHSKPKSPLSLLHRKLGNAWLKHAIEHQPDADGWWELSIKKLSENIGFDSNNRQYLKESAEALMRVVFEWDVIAPLDKRVQWKASVLFPEIEIRSDAIRYQISSQMRERMINPEIYAMIDMNVVRRFRRASSLAIWEFCVRFERIGRTAEVEWRIFRDMVLGESPDNISYQEYKYFKSKVVNPAITEINHESNHMIGLVEERIGKRVATIRFNIDRKAKPEALATDGQSAELVGEMLAIGVPRSEARKLAAANGQEQIRNALDYIRRRMADPQMAKLQNPAAYFRQALNNGYAVGDGAAAGKEVVRQRPAPAMDIKEIYAAQQTAEAEDYFNELDAGEQMALIESYNGGQPVPSLRLNAKATKLAQAAFFRWLSRETWGEPSADQLLELAQRMLADRQGN
ncbi:MAG: replication initiation protein [Bacteroidota bacterium]